jgi:outer membrane protein OmpA-like peptidoglycan-associated protein
MRLPERIRPTPGAKPATAAAERGAVGAVVTDKAQICRLQGAIKYTVNSDLLFPSGGWQICDRGKQIISTLAAKLAPTQQNKILVSGDTDNRPVGPALEQQGITSNQDLSQKRAENVMEFIISQGVKPDLISARGFGGSGCFERHTTGPRAEPCVELSVPASGC